MANSDMANTYRWYDYNYYYPIYPTIPSSSATIASDSGYNIAANQTYWQPLAPMIQLNLCVNGATQTAYVAGVISGSVFNPDLLPYS